MTTDNQLTEIQAAVEAEHSRVLEGEASPQSRETKDAGAIYLEQIQGAESAAELNQIWLEQYRKEAERVEAEGWHSPFYSEKTAKELEKSDSPEALVAQAEQAGIRVDIYSEAPEAEQRRQALQRGEIPHEGPRMTPEELSLAIARAQTPAEISALMASQKLVTHNI